MNFYDFFLKDIRSLRTTRKANEMFIHEIVSPKNFATVKSPSKLPRKTRKSVTPRLSVLWWSFLLSNTGPLSDITYFICENIALSKRTIMLFAFSPPACAANHAGALTYCKQKRLGLANSNTLLLNFVKSTFTNSKGSSGRLVRRVSADTWPC